MKISFIFLLLVSNLVYSTNYREDSYNYYSLYGGVVVSDSVFSNLFLKENKKIVFVGSDNLTPIVYSDGESISLSGHGGGSYQMWNPDESSLEIESVAEKINLYLADFNGDGYIDQLLQSKGYSPGNVEDGNLIIIYGGVGGFPLKVEVVQSPMNSMSDKSSNLSAKFAKLTIDDFNSDGNSDIRVDYISGVFANKFGYVLEGELNGVGLPAHTNNGQCF